MLDLLAVMTLTVTAAPVQERAVDKDRLLASIVGRVATEELTPIEAWGRIDGTMIPALFAAWRDGRLHGGAVLDVKGAGWLRGAIEDRPEREWIAFLELLAREERSPDDLRAGIEVIAMIGGPSRLDLLMSWTAPESGPVPFVARRALEEELQGFVAEDAKVIWKLRDGYSSWDDVLLPMVIEAVAEGEPAEALSVFGSILGRVSTVDHLVLRSVADLARPAPFLADEFLCGSVRQYLGSRDVTLIHGACQAAGATSDVRAIPELIQLLDHDEANLRSAALAALREITALPFGPKQSQWAAWHEEETAWWQESAGAALADLRRGDPAATIGALREVASKRLYDEDLCDALIDCLNRSTGPAADMACRVLVRCRSERVVPVLIETLRREDEAVAGAARASLMQLTGRDLGPDPSAWLEVDG